tara:strand:+ start:1382 stop:1972 length:591 start_codon:yes stop_codon:yes gene_type:complete
MKSFEDMRDSLVESLDVEKEYGKAFVSDAQAVGVQRKLVRDINNKLKTIEDSLGGKAGNGLTPDNIKADPKWKATKKELDIAFKKEQDMNKMMSKTYSKQMRDLRQKDRKAYTAMFIAKESIESDDTTDMLAEGALVTRNTDALDYLMQSVKKFVQSNDYNISSFNRIGAIVGLSFDDKKQRKGFIYVDKGRVKVR